VGIIGVPAMVKTSLMNNFNEYMDNLNKIKLDPSRKNLKAINPKITLGEQITLALKEGFALLEAEEKTKISVKPNAPHPSQDLEDALANKSDNPYVKARAQVLKSMTPEQRSIIEKMDHGILEKDRRYDDFVKRVRIKGDQLSS
jgi:hypothetical protein